MYVATPNASLSPYVRNCETNSSVPLTHTHLFHALTKVICADVALSLSKSRFDSSIGGLQFADQFIQVGTKLNTEYFYGLGEHEHTSFAHDMNWRTWGMWANDFATAVS